MSVPGDDEPHKPEPLGDAARPSEEAASPDAENPWAASDAASEHEAAAPVLGEVEPHRGTLILVLGITGLVLTVCGGSGTCCPLGCIPGIISWVMGHRDLRAMREGHMDPTGRDTTLAGYICGIVSVILGILVLVALIAYLIFVVVVMGASGAPIFTQF